MIRKNSFYAILVTLSLLSASFANAAETTTCKCSYADLVEPLLPAVVNISISQKATSMDGRRMPGFPPGSPFEEFNQFFEKFGMVPPDAEDDNEDADGGEQDLRLLPAGSGFIINKSGYIVTNYHVIAESDKVTVILHSDKKYEAKVIGSDSRTDLALLKIDTKEDLPFVNFGNSDEARVGDPIIAIGNPFALGGTVTTGIISARAREINAGQSSLVDNFIQTDAALNKGNSGGPMFNMRGEVIGINSAIYSPSGGNVGIGFAVPSSLAEPIIKQIQKEGKVSRGMLGVMIDSTEGKAEGLGIKDGKGALVVDVTSGSSAEKAGINIGDIILKFDGKEISSSKKLPRIVAETPVGKPVTVDLLSKGKAKSVSVTLTEMDDKLGKPGKKNSKTGDLDKTDIQGISVTNLDAKLRQKYRMNDSVKGVLVVGVKKGSNGARSGLRSGDVIVAVNQVYVANTEDFKKLLNNAKQAKLASVMLWVNRNNMNIFTQLQVK